MLTKSVYSLCDMFPRNTSEDIDDGTIKINKNHVVFPTQLEFKNEVKEYFNLISISDNAMIGGCCFFNLYSLEKCIKGLEGWQDEEWLTTWIPIGNTNSDIVFIKSELTSQNVYAWLTGSPEPFLIANSIALFFEALTACMTLEMDLNYDIYIDESCCEISEEFLGKVHEILSRSLSDDTLKGFMEFFFG